MMREVTIGIGGAAGDGLDKSGDTLAKTAARLGLYVYAYNSYQSIIRGGHIWLRVRCSEGKVYSHGDQLNLFIALNQDSIERHAPEVNPRGAVIFNSDKLKLDPALLRNNVLSVPLPVAALTKPFGRVQPVMQNTVALGALIFLIGLNFETTIGVLADTFQHKGQAVIDQNVGIARAGYDYATEHFVPLGYQWDFTRIQRPFITGNEAIALAAATAGCKFYSAYPMTPASSILHWMVAHAENCGIVVKQCEDEIAVVNMAIGAGHAGVRAMCATSGGGFALMTEGVGMAGMIEAPLVIVEVQRGGPSTGLPTKTEQADLNQVLGASQGDFPRIVVAPSDVTDASHITVQAFNLAEKYQLPVLIISDLLLSEHPETIEPDALRRDVAIDRGEILTEWPSGNGTYKRYQLTASGISPRVLPGTANAAYVAATDEHDEEGILISDMFTTPAVRRKIQEKRMRKLELALRDLEAPKLEGPGDADVTLLGWGSTRGVIKEAVAILNAAGTRANQLHFKWMLPFHAREALEILRRCKKTICVEGNYSGQFSRHLRAETGLTVDDHILKYDGEPFEPDYIVQEVGRVMEGRSRSLEVTLEEAKEMAYHYIRTHLGEGMRPVAMKLAKGDGIGEDVWQIQVATRESGQIRGALKIGLRTGAMYGWQPVASKVT
ncbi:MAG: 2-oxoacid:acceptor oxidoreductase subunit alpha [Acidobacteria bacterium]|nr:2-oxoacid:acceptor oxidoreductase subunit alpha [Acidobacteriota bacterium]